MAPIGRVRMWENWQGVWIESLQVCLGTSRVSYVHGFVWTSCTTFVRHFRKVRDYAHNGCPGNLVFLGEDEKIGGNPFFKIYFSFFLALNKICTCPVDPEDVIISKTSGRTGVKCRVGIYVEF